MASRGPPTGPSLLTIARLSHRRPSFSRTRVDDTTGKKTPGGALVGEPGHTRDKRDTRAHAGTRITYSTGISRRTRHELQAHHGHVALLNRPRAGPALVCEVLVWM